MHALINVDKIDQINIDPIHTDLRMTRELTATEAAARLGVKRATLYAYVSRGLLHRFPAADGRTSAFDAKEVEAFRSRRRRATEGEVDAVISTALTQVTDGKLLLRGRDLLSMVKDDMTFEAVADWLWAGEAQRWMLPQDVSAAVVRAGAALPPSASLIERLRVTTSVVSALDPMRANDSAAGMSHAGRMLLLAMVEGLPLHATMARAEPLSERLWPRLARRRENIARRRTLNAAMCLLVDHSLAASTFAARIAASVRADPYSIVSAGLGVVGGALHGAASRRVHDLFASAAKMGDAAAAAGESQRRWGQPPGYGHKLYRRQDARYAALMTCIDDAWRQDPRLATVHEVVELVGRRTEAIPNIDLAMGAMTWLAGMPPDAGEAIFSIARTAGWIAHGLEEFKEAPVRFRPRARYIGPRG